MRRRRSLAAVILLGLAAGCHHSAAHDSPVIARGVAPDFPDPPPLHLDPDALRELVRTPAYDGAWVASTGAARISRTAVPGAPLPREEASAAGKPAPEATVAVSKPAAVAVPTLIPPPLFPDRAAAKDDGIVLVGGVAVPVPRDALKPGAVRPPAVVAQPMPLTVEPPIRLPDVPRALPPLKELPPVPATPPMPPPLPAATRLQPAPVAPPPAPPALLPAPSAVVPGPIDVGGVPVPFDSLSRMVDGGDGFAGIGGGCASCGGASCRPGQKACEPFPARNAAGRFIGLVYEGLCCPDPCYQPRWEPIAAAAFFVDAPRPVTQTRVRWDYGNHFAFPDRGEFFWPRADGASSAKGPKPNAPARGVPALDYHEIYLDQEIATGGGLGSATITVPYRSVNPTPFAESAAGFGDMQITAKSLLFDSELFLFAFQMRTYIPAGNFRKGLGTGHLSLEPGVIAGIRVGPSTYAVAQVQEWIPIAGDKDYMGAAARYHFAFNHVLWRPVKDVQLIGTWETQAISFQDGAFTEAVLGPLQKLSGQTSVSMGVGSRLFFCDKFDLGAGYSRGISGKYLVRDQMRVEFRYRY